MEVGERLTVIQQHKKEDVVGNEMVDQPPLMEPEERKGEEIEQAASESRHLADELEGMVDHLEIEEKRGAAVNAVVPGEQEEVEGDDDDDGREGAGNAEEIVENPFFNGLDEEGFKGFLIKREAKGQEANEEEELKKREEDERTRKGHEAEQRVEEEAERPARKTEVSCVGIRQKRPSVIVATDVSPAVLEKSEKERMDRARMMEEMLRDHYKEKSEKETTANGHVRGIKEEITLVED